MEEWIPGTALTATLIRSSKLPKMEMGDLSSRVTSLHVDQIHRLLV
jgi:hypothetical protein